GGLVEVEECVGVQDDLAGGRGDDGRFGDGLAAAFGSGGGRPECIAPAVFAARVFPDMAVNVGPVVGSRGGADGGHGSDGESNSDFGGFVHVSPRLSMMLESDRSEPPPHIERTLPV